MAYPSDITTFSNPQGTTSLATDDHANQHRLAGSAIVALENKLGVGSGSASVGKVLVGTGNGTSSWGSTVNNALLGTPTITSGTITLAVINTSTIGTPAITGGTANGLVLGTPTIGTITVPGTTTALGFSAAIAPGVGTITDVAGGTLTVNAQTGNIFYSALGTSAGNRTIATPLNLTGYQQLTYAFKASGSANGTVAWGTIFRFSQDIGTPAIGTGTTWNYYGWRYNPIDGRLDFQGQSKNII